MNTTTIKPVDLETAGAIQTRISEFAHSGYDLDGEYYWNTCVAGWIADGYDRQEVEETASAALEELRRTYGN